MDLFWVSCIAAGASFACAAYLALTISGQCVGRLHVPNGRARDDSDDATSKADQPMPSPFSGAVWHVAMPWLRVLGQALMPLLSWRLRTVLAHQWQAGGMLAAWDLAAAVGLLAYVGLGGAVVGVVLGVCLSESAERLPAIVLCAGFAGAIAMIWLLWRHVRTLAMRRRQAMLREFPFLLDVMTLCVQAGLNMHAALRQAAHHGPPGPLREELRLVLNAIRAGQERYQALEDMAARCDLPALTLWVAAVHQADRLGMSLGPLLQAQAAQQRSERFLRAETLAMQAPVRLLFPLVTCLFPCAFLVIGFPVTTLLLQSLP